MEVGNTANPARKEHLRLQEFGGNSVAVALGPLFRPAPFYGEPTSDTPRDSERSPLRR